MKWIEEHQAICNKNEDTCEHCYIIEESLWALKEAHYEMDQKKNQPKPEPQPQPKPKWNYKLGRYM